MELNQDLLLMREFTDQVFTYEILGEIPKQLQQYVNGLKKFQCAIIEELVYRLEIIITQTRLLILFFFFFLC